MGKYPKRCNMTITLDLEPDAEARLRTRAAQFGQDIPAYLQDVAQREALYPMNEPLKDEEFERLSDELADSIGPAIPPLSDEAMSRASFYEDRF